MIHIELKLCEIYKLFRVLEDVILPTRSRARCSFTRILS